jgi:hypothetical protein
LGAVVGARVLHPAALSLVVKKAAAPVVVLPFATRTFTLDLGTVVGVVVART